MKILVTGATGFIGTHLCAALREAGHEVVACVRSRLRANDEYVVETGDLVSFTGWDAALDGVDAVVHLAGRVHQTSAQAAQDEAAFEQANVVATKKLLQACEAHGVKRFMFMSTIAVFGCDSGEQPYKVYDNSPLAGESKRTESDWVGGNIIAMSSPPPNRVPLFDSPARGELSKRLNHNPFNPYSHSKAKAENLVASSALHWSIIRIPLVYGAGVRANFLSLMQMVNKGVPLPFGRVNNKRSVVYVGNLVDAIIYSLECEAAYNQVLHIADSNSLSSPELVRALAQAAGVRPRLLPVPASWLKLGAKLLGKPMLYQKLCGNLELETASTHALINWHPPHSTQEGLRETMRWFKQEA